MPTYEYACKDCNEHLEVVQSFKDDALTECPSCHGSLRKVFSAAGIIFKGSGWHVKDYASSSNRPAGRDADSSDGDAGAESDTASPKDSANEAGSTGVAATDGAGKTSNKNGAGKASDNKARTSTTSAGSDASTSSSTATEKKSA